MAIGTERPSGHSEGGEASASGVGLTVVSPVYGCAGCLEELHRRLTDTIAEMPVESYEMILVDDRSRDGAWAILSELANRDPHVRAVRLSRNFGQHPAITAGLELSRGEWTVVMDCDLQEPPEELPRLLRTARAGHDIVLTRRARRSHGLRRRLGAQLFFWIRKRLLKVEIPPETGDLSILSRKAVDAFCSLRDLDRQYLMVLHWIGFDSEVIEIEHSERADGGRSSYSFRALVGVALDGIFFQTTVLLRWIVMFGFGVAVGAGLLAAAVLVSYLAGDPFPGWTSMVLLLLVLSSVIIVSIGVTALYLGKVFEQVKGRPLYVIDEIRGGSPARRDPTDVAEGTPVAAPGRPKTSRAVPAGGGNPSDRELR